MALFTGRSVGRGVPGFVGAFAMTSGITKAHALLLLLFLISFPFRSFLVLRGVTFARTPLIRRRDKLYVPLVILQRCVAAFYGLRPQRVSRPASSLDVFARITNLPRSIILTFQSPSLAISWPCSLTSPPSRAMCMLIFVTIVCDVRQRGRLLTSQ